MVHPNQRSPMLLTAEKESKEKIRNNDIAPSARAILKTLLYFNIFRHPLTMDEIHEYCCGYSATKIEVQRQLEMLEETGYISRQDVFYQVKSDEMHTLVEKRLKGYEKAKKFLKIARPFSKFISCFPFVRGICLSGSLSKGYADNDSDIDYFIITEPGRLWISRTLLVLFKKLFLFNSHKYFCVNYFIDTNSLEIPDKNLFAATELLTIIPASNPELYEKLMSSNAWVKTYYPNGVLKTSKYDVLPAKRRIIQRVGEVIFSGKFGNRMDNLCFKATLSAWKRKFKKFNEDEFDLKLRTRKNVSKHHPNGFQSKVMESFSAQIKSFEQRFNISLD
jgi:hypothetical protein